MFISFERARPAAKYEAALPHHSTSTLKFTKPYLVLNSNFEYIHETRAGDVGAFFPAFQASEDGLPCITKRARPGVCVGGRTRQRLTTLFPELCRMTEV